MDNGGELGRRSRRLVAVKSERERAVIDAAGESRATRASKRRRPESSRPGLRKRQRPSYREVEEEEGDSDDE